MHTRYREWTLSVCNFSSTDEFTQAKKGIMNTVSTPSTLSQTRMHVAFHIARNIQTLPTYDIATFKMASQSMGNPAMADPKGVASTRTLYWIPRSTVNVVSPRYVDYSYEIISNNESSKSVIKAKHQIPQRLEESLTDLQLSKHVRNLTSAFDKSNGTHLELPHERAIYDLRRTFYSHTT